MSVNDAYTGKRFKTQACRQFCNDVGYQLKAAKLGPPPYEIYLEFGFSNDASDYDGPIKIFQDILQKKYNFNDKKITRAVVEKNIVPIGSEYIIFELKSRAPA